MQVSHCIHTKISSTGNIQGHQGRCRTDIRDIVQEKRDRDYRGTMYGGSCAYAGEDTTEIFGIRNSRILKGKKFAYDIRKTCKSKV